MQGFLLVDKPSGITSFGAVARIKRLANEKRVGHTGTLDPMATGVLPIFIGKATALSSYLAESDKKYVATVRLGLTTDTDDITGNIIAASKVGVSDDDVISALSGFKGRVRQTPPVYSAIKQNGVRLYRLARQGLDVKAPEREVEIKDISLISGLDEQNEFSFSATVSKGTYIRSLARDIGETLGCGATLSRLKRTFVSNFDIKDAVPLDSLTSENIKEYIKNEADALPFLTSIGVTEKQAVRFANGGELSLDRLNANGLCDRQIIKVFFGNTFIGLGIVSFEKQMLLIKCNINRP